MIVFENCSIMCFTPLCVPIETGDTITYHIPSFLISDFLWFSSMNICICVYIYIYMCVCVCVCVCVCIIQGFPGGSNGKESACNAGDLGSVPGLGRSPGKGNGYPLHYFCLENPMDRGAWRATVHGVAKSWT